MPTFSGTLHRGQGAQHPGHFVEALKQIAHGPVENPAQARQDLHRQGGLAVFDLGQLPLGDAGPLGQDHGGDAGGLPQFAHPGAHPLLDPFFQVVVSVSFPLPSG